MSVEPGDSRSADTEPVELDRDERRALYQLLQAEVPRRLQRVEYWLLALTIAIAAPKVGGPAVPEVATSLLRFLS